MSMKVSIKKLIKDQSLSKKVFPHNPLSFQTINPVNNKLLNSFNYDSDEKLNTILDKSEKSSRLLKSQSLDDQLKKMSNLVSVFERRKEELASLITLEMGKPIFESRIEVDRINSLINYFILHSPRLLSNKKLEDLDCLHSYVKYEPLGTILNITPWNLPLAMPCKSIIPALIARNSTILKPAPNVPQTSILFHQCFIEAGFTNEEFQLSFANIDSIDKIISDKRINFVSFTGSTQAGRTIGRLAGENIKRSLLELGGSDPTLVLPDANVEYAVDALINGRIRANGQTCTSAKRAIIHESIYDKFINILELKMKTIQFGDPKDEKTRLGPISRFDLFLKLNSQLDEYIEDYDYDVSSGNFLKPFIIQNPKKGTKAYIEEIFGPVFTTFKSKSIEDMIELANDTEYGLGGVIITNDLEKGQEIAGKIQCGMTCVNTPYITHPSIPFGGCKNSGFGRTNLEYILNEVSNLKSVTVNTKKV